MGADKWVDGMVRETLARCADNGIDWKDIHDPDEWPTASGSRKTELTHAALFDIVRAWLDARVASSRTYLQIDPEVSELMARHGFELGQQRDELPYTFEEAVIDARAQVRIADRARVHRRTTPVLRTYDPGLLQAFLGGGQQVRPTLTILVNFAWARKRYRAVVRRGDEAALPAVALNAGELRNLLRYWRRNGSAAPAHPPVVVCELAMETDVLSVVAGNLKGHGLEARKVALPLAAEITGDVFMPINYIAHSLPAIMEQVPGTACNIDVQAGDGRLGVVLFLPDDPEIHACIKVIPRYDMAAYLTFQAALNEQGRLKIAGPTGLNVAYRHMLQAVIDLWEPL